MAGRFPYVKLTAYPHLGPKDAALWERHIQKFPEKYVTVDYDTKVGAGAIPKEEVNKNVFKKDFRELTRKRIDVIGYAKNGKIDCIELRPNAGNSAIGSIFTNHFLLQENDDFNPCNPIIITDKAQPDIVRAAGTLGITTIELGF